MNTQVLPDPGSIAQKRGAAETKPERVEATSSQEQFTGPLPERGERPAAELLRERQGESDAASACMAFVP